MNKLAKCKVLLVIMLVVGLSVASAGCNLFGGDDDDDNDGGDGGTGPSRSITVLNTTITLSANNNYCANLTFRLTQVWDTTVRVTGPSNTDPDFYVYSPTGQNVVSGESGASGSETRAFEPPLAGTYGLRVCEYKHLGGTFSVLVTQMMQ